MFSQILIWGTNLNSFDDGFFAPKHGHLAQRVYLFSIDLVQMSG